MKLDILSFDHLISDPQEIYIQQLKNALFTKGIVGICDIPEFVPSSQAYIEAARRFIALDPLAQKKYAPNRDAGETEGYELGAEKFKNKQGQWQIDDKKASFYAFVPDSSKNKWPVEVDLKTPYLALGQLIFNVGRHVMNAIGLNYCVGLDHNYLVGYGRMLHYHKEQDFTNENPDWCGGHFDHGVFTGLIPAYYFQNGLAVEEPPEAGLYIVPTHSQQFEKVEIDRKDVLLFQVGEFGQLATHDKIQATQHKVCKAYNGIERFTFALFYSVLDHVTIHSHSQLIEDERYKLNQNSNGSIDYGAWQTASFERYRATTDESIVS